MAGQRDDESQADWIRRFVIENLDSLAKCRAGRLVIRAGDVARAMRLSHRLPNICSVLRGRKFQEEAGLTLIETNGPPQSTTTEFVYECSGSTQAVRPGTDSSTDKKGEQVDPELETTIRRRVIENLGEVVSDEPEERTLGGRRPNESQADWIRRFVIENLDSLAKCRAGRLVIRAGDVAKAMDLPHRLPNICSVLRGRKFQEEAGLTLIETNGPPQSTTTELVYECSGSTRAVRPGADSSTDEKGEQVKPELETTIRRQVIENLDELAPLRRIIRAGDVADSMGLEGRTADVCRALSSRRFQEEARLHLEDAVFQYVPAPKRGAPDPSGIGDFVAGVARAASIEAAREFGGRYGESGAGAAETDPDLPPDHDPTGPATECGESPGPDACDSVVEPATDVTDSTEDRPAVVLCLVSCVGTKRQFPALAKSLYISDWFIKARRVVEMEGWRWFVLSAKHGLLDPEEPIEPYEKTLDTMSAAERRSWASEVWKALEPHLAEVRSVVFFAGRKYREHLESRLRDHGLDVQVPMEGLRRGDQLAWLKRRIDGR